MGFEKVFIRHGDDGYSLTKEILRNLITDTKKLTNKKILIKPNAGRLVKPHLGINTNPEVIAGILDFFLEAGINNIIIGDSPIIGVKALESLEKCGISEIARKRNIPLVDLDALPPVLVKIPNGRIIKQLKLCKQAVESDFIISVPVMKTHMHTQVSLGLKNMKGCLYKREKIKLHQLPPSKAVKSPAKPLDAAISDMAAVLMPHLTIIDGTIGQEGLGPGAGKPIKASLVIGSFNCLAADWAASKLMGFNPGKIHHLMLSIDALKNKDKKYDIKKEGIAADPPDYLKWKTKFEAPPKKISLEFSNVIVDDKDACSSCLSTLLMFLKNYYYQEFADYFTSINPLRFAVGKGVGPQSKNTILIGNCAYKQKKNGIFIQGCPPVASQIKKEINKIIHKKH